MRAFLLAAGLGTRLRPLTHRVPKCLLEVGGQPLLGRWLESLARAGVESVLVNTHHLADRVQGYLGSVELPLEVKLVHEPELLGSGGTLAAQRDFVARQETFLVVYADNASTVDLADLVAAHRDDAAATLGLFRVPDPENRGVVALDDAGWVTEFEEKPARPRSNLAWAGLLLATPALLDAIPERRPCDLGHHVLPRLVGRMRGVALDGYHADVGTPENYQRVRQDFERMQASA